MPRERERDRSRGRGWRVRCGGERERRTGADRARERQVIRDESRDGGKEQGCVDPVGASEREQRRDGAGDTWQVEVRPGRKYTVHSPTGFSSSFLSRSCLPRFLADGSFLRSEGRCRFVIFKGRYRFTVYFFSPASANGDRQRIDGEFANASRPRAFCFLTVTNGTFCTVRHLFRCVTAPAALCKAELLN